MNSNFSHKTLLITCTFILSAVISFSQEVDEKLASQYFNNGEFSKAEELYLKLFNEQHSSGKLNGKAFYYYNGYIRCLVEQEQYTKAEKFVKKLVKKHTENLGILVDLGAIHEEKGDVSSADNQYKQALKLLNDNLQVSELANAFIAHNKYNYAVEVYKKGRKLSNNRYRYHFELADIYASQGKIEPVLNEYLDALDMGMSALQDVQNSLYTFLNDGTNERTELLKEMLVRKIQKFPDKDVYAELLIWYYIQGGEFSSAFIHAKALDKRLKEDGSRILSLAEVSKNNFDYKTAAKCYEYIISKGQGGNFYYIQCRIDLLDVLTKQITLMGQYSQEDLVELEQKYVTTLGDLGKYSQTAILYKDLAHLKALYLNKADEAIALLEDIIKFPGLEPLMLAECKIELGDIYLISGDIWEAALYYGQVNKAFKHDVIGQEAKFRNAKLSYYQGDFYWAQAQLDILKAATTKLIANDALQLSLTITDNLGLDSIAEPLQMFARADLHLFKNNLDSALILLDSITFIWPNHQHLSDDILFQKAVISFKQGKHEDAAKLYQQVIDKYSYDILADDAMFRLAEITENILKDKEKAMELYKRILLEHSSSVYVTEARKRFRKLRGDQLEEEDIFINN